MSLSALGQFNTDLMALFGLDADTISAYTLNATGDDIELYVTHFVEVTGAEVIGAAELTRKYRVELSVDEQYAIEGLIEGPVTDTSDTTPGESP